MIILRFTNSHEETSMHIQKAQYDSFAQLQLPT